MKSDLEGLVAASDAVRRGNLICYPTDTVYGLGCDPLNPDAVARVFAAKERHDRAMPVLVGNVSDAAELVDFSQSARRLVARFWPGSLTLVLPAKSVVPSILVPEGTLGVRAPKHAICQQLLGLCNGHLVGTSANLTGQAPATCAQEIAADLHDRVEVILDGGKSFAGVASTVVDMTQRHLEVLREGPIAKMEILRCIRGK